MIEAIHTQRGYLDIVAFLNNEFAIPTSGLHAPVVTAIQVGVTVTDYWLYVQEVYSDLTTYKGVYFVTQDSELIYLENQIVKYVNTVPAEVQHLFMMESGGLSSFLSDTIDLYNTQTGLKEAELQNSLSVFYGAEVFYTYLKEGALFSVSGEGIIQGLTATGQILSNYNVKIDKDTFTRIELVAIRNRKTEFTIEVAPKVFEKFVYYTSGEHLYVVDTPMARQQIAVLISRQVVFADI